MKVKGNGYTIECEDIKDSDKPQRIIAPIKVSIESFRDLTQCKRCMHAIDKSDTACQYCGEGQ